MELLLLILETKDSVIYNAYKQSLDDKAFDKHESILYLSTQIWYIADQELKLDYFYQSLNAFSDLCREFINPEDYTIEWTNVVPTHDIELFIHERVRYNTNEQTDKKYVKDLDSVESII